MATRTIAAGPHTVAYDFTLNNYTVTNLGTVSVAGPNAIAFSGSSGTLINAGGVTGASYAVLFTAGSANRLVDDPGASFSGTVSGGNTVGGAFVSTLELASAAGTGTLGGLGSQFVDFGVVKVDTGAKWSLAAGDTVVAGASFTNLGTLSGAGITLASGASFYQNALSDTITNASGVAVYGNASGAVSVANYGVISGGGASGIGVYLKAGGTVDNQSNGGSAASTISGVTGIRSGADATIVNAGMIGSTSNGPGIQLVAGGTVTNRQGGTISSGTGNAVQAAGHAITLYNYGVIKAATVGSISGVYSSAGGSVTNNAGGSIVTSYGVVLRGAAGTVVNNGVITASTAAGKSDGVGFGKGGSVTNQVSGSIVGYFGVSIAGAAATVTNAGAITGIKDAVTLASGFSNSVIAQPGAVFTGTVDGGNKAGSTTFSTLEFTTGSGTGILAGLGSQFVNFSQIKIDAGSTWLSSGANTIAAKVTLTNAGNLVVVAGADATTLGSAGSSGTVAVTILTGGSLSNSAVITGGVAGGGATGLPGTTGAGIGGAGGVGGAAVALVGGTLQNGGAVTGGLGGAGGTGGTSIISGIGGTGGAGGKGGSGVSLTANATLTNTNVIIGGVGGVGGLGGTGGSGSPQGLGGAGGAGGAGIYGTSGFISNAGTVQGAAGGLGGIGFVMGASGAGAVGIALTGGATITNQSGALIAGMGGADAILLGTGTSRVIIDPGAAFTGNVDGGNTTGTLVSVLELASGASAGVLTGGLGVKYLDFGQVVVDSGAQWTLNGTGTLTNIVLTDNGTLTNLVAERNGNANAGYGITIGTGGTLINKNLITATSDNAVSGRAGTITVINYNQLFGNRSNASGIYMGGGGSVTNQSAGQIQALYGIRAGGVTTILNNGQINSDATAGGAAILLADGGSISNQNSGLLQPVGASGGDGIMAISQPVTVVNSGQISGSNHTLNATVSGAGISLAAGGMVTNLSHGIINNGVYGIRASGGATTVVNYGEVKASLIAGYAILLGAGFSNRVVLHPGFSGGGTVSGGNSIGAAAISTLELAANSPASTGSLTGLGALYTDFARVAEDAGARWQFNGTNTVAYGVTLTDAGTLTNTGTIIIANGTAGTAGTISGSTPVAGTAGQPGAQSVTILSGGTLRNNNIISGGAGGAGGAGAVGTAADGQKGSAGGAGGAGTSGVLIAAGGAGTNVLTITGGAGGAGGVGGDAGGGAATDGAGGGVGGAGGAGVTLTGGTITNTGTITGGTGGIAGNAGANFVGAGASGGAGGAGIGGSFGVVINNATIDGSAGGAGGTGTTTGVAGANGAGIAFTGGGTVTNNGVIAGAGGADAISFGIGTSRLIYVPGATFAGVVDGGNTIGSTIVSTLELGTTTTAGSLSAQGTLVGLSGEFLNFAQVQVDAGATWIVGSGNTLASGASLIDQGVLLDIGQTINGGGAVTIASTAGDIASETVSAGGNWTSASQLVVGAAGSGLFLVGPSGTAGASAVDVAAGAGGSGTVTVAGGSSRFTDLGSFTVGDAGLGSLSINAGGSAAAASMLVADSAGASGSTVQLSGAGSQLTVSGVMSVGAVGFGSLQLSGSATASAGSLDTGAAADAAGVVTVSGVGTSLVATGSLIVGDLGTGELSVLSGAQLSAANITIGAQTGSTGNVDVEGNATQLTVSGTVTIGGLGSGVFTLGSGTTLTTGGGVFTTINGVFNQSGEVDPPHVVNDGQTNLSKGARTLADISIENSNEYTLQNGAATMYTPLITFDANPATDQGSTQGTWLISNAGTLVLNADTVDASQTIDFSATNAVLEIGQHPSVANGTITGTVAAGAANVLPGFGAPIENYRSGDKITFPGLTFGSDTASGNVVTLWSGLAGTGTQLGSLDFITPSGAPDSAGALLADTQIATLACFAEGTRVRTVAGLVRVEALSVGDRVVTQDGVEQPVVWIGSRTVDCARHPAPETVWPVRVEAGAFGDNVPVRDLYLSPDHAVFVDGVLVPVKLLINGGTIEQVKRRTVTYYHVELPAHDVILAEDLPVESYLDTGDRGNFEDEHVVRLFPDFDARLKPEAALVWEANGCAELVRSGLRLHAARESLARRTSAQVLEIFAGNVDRVSLR